MGLYVAPSIQVISQTYNEGLMQTWSTGIGTGAGPGPGAKPGGDWSGDWGDVWSDPEATNGTTATDDDSWGISK